MRNLSIGLFLVLICFGLRAAERGMQKNAARSSAATTPAPEHDLSGVWNMHQILDATFAANPPDMTAWGKQKYEAAKPSNGPRTHPLREINDPVLTSCLPPGVPRIYLHPFPMEIVQTSKETLLLYEYDHIVRRVFTDGRNHTSDITPTYMGESIGHWEGDTFVVDTIGFNDKTWLDRDGHAHSDQLHVIERFRRPDHDNMQIDVTMEDPKALVKPWVTRLSYQLRPQWDVQEQVCTDNAAFLEFEK